jgi:hypothetical protein
MESTGTIITHHNQEYATVGTERNNNNWILRIKCMEWPRVIGWEETYNKTSSTPPLFIESHLLSQKSDLSCIWLLEVSSLPLRFWYIGFWYIGFWNVANRVVFVLFLLLYHWKNKTNINSEHFQTESMPMKFNMKQKYRL